MHLPRDYELIAPARAMCGDPCGNPNFSIRMDSISGNGSTSDRKASAGENALECCASLPYSRHLIFWALATVGCAADLLTKQWIFNAPKLHDGAVWWLWQGHVGFQKSLNEGALFGLGQGKVWLFAIFSLAAVIAIPVWLFCYQAARDRWLTITLGAILGGILGNLYDRLGMHGLQWENFIPQRQGPIHAVRDWILVCWDFEAGIIWPNFNIADSLLVCGAASLMLHAFLFRESEQKKAA